ncbi:MAG: hypothetical protein ACJAZO_001116 [Myxococcota bacterium]|jgi:hypothetical protein
MRFLALVLMVACSGGEEKAPKDLNELDSTSNPGKRSEILALGDESFNTMVLFGGNNGPIVNQVPAGQFLEDTWVFEPGEGWTEIEAAEHPSARGRYSFDLDPNTHKGLLFGGRFRDGTSGDYTLRDDLWSFDYETRSWTVLDAGGDEDGPVGRYYPASGFDAETSSLYLWGGLTNTSAVSLTPGRDFWKWDGSDWTELDTSGDAPSRRGFFGDMYDSQRKRIVIFGGQRGDFSSLAFQDTYALDVTTGEWTQLDDGTGPAPSTRMHAHMQYDAASDRYLLFGGHTDIGDMNDLWVFDPNNPGWVPLYEADTFTDAGLGCNGSGREVPSDYVEMDLNAPERRHRGMYTLMWNSLWLFGGIHAECSDQLDDTWRFDLETLQWTELIEATTGEACARRGDACDCLCY